MPGIFGGRSALAIESSGLLADQFGADRVAEDLDQKDVVARLIGFGMDLKDHVRAGFQEGDGLEVDLSGELHGVNDHLADLRVLSDDEVHVWASYLNAHEARLKHLYPLLSNAEKERSERFKFYKHRKAFIASHGFLHSVLAQYVEPTDDGFEFIYGKQGKPCLIESQNKQNIQFNLSHSNNLALLAICKNKNIGIDVEYTKRKSDWQGIIKRFFTPAEQNKIFKLPESEQKNAFFQVWTRKEAHMKVTGLGLHLSPTQFEVSVPPEAAKFIENLKNQDNQFYKMKTIILPDSFSDYQACLSANFDFNKIIQFINN